MFYILSDWDHVLFVGVCPCSIFRSKQVESPLTAVDFTPDGAGLVVGSTQGRIYMYDLRNLSAPVKTTTAHKTSVTCIRFQHSNTRLKVCLQCAAYKLYVCICI